jgi:hypothetical protein
MKGLIFVELIRFLEETQSPAFADAVISAAGLESDGAYTAHANYSSTEAVKLLVTAGTMLNIDAVESCRRFGHYIFQRFLKLYPNIMMNYKSAEEMLMFVGSHIHAEVRILYPDARTPHITATPSDGALAMTYASHRAMAPLALGLIEACMTHFGDTRTLTWAFSNGNRAAEFVLKPTSHG